MSLAKITVGLLLVALASVVADEAHPPGPPGPHESPVHRMLEHWMGRAANCPFVTCELCQLYVAVATHGHHHHHHHHHHHEEHSLDHFEEGHEHHEGCPRERLADVCLLLPRVELIGHCKRKAREVAHHRHSALFFCQAVHLCPPRHHHHDHHHEKQV